MADCFITRKNKSEILTPINLTIPDIYNSGGVVGLNGDVFHVDRSKYNIYSLFKTNPSGADVTFNDNSLAAKWSPNQMWYIPTLISTKGYKYLCVEAEVLNGANGQYNISDFGIMKKLNSTARYMPDYFNFAYFTNYNNSIYRFPRGIKKIDVSEHDGVYLAAHCCHCDFSIYSIFLSNEE